MEDAFAHTRVAPSWSRRARANMDADSVLDDRDIHIAALRVARNVSAQLVGPVQSLRRHQRRARGRSQAFPT